MDDWRHTFDTQIFAAPPTSLQLNKPTVNQQAAFLPAERFSFSPFSISFQISPLCYTIYEIF